MDRCARRQGLDCHDPLLGVYVHTFDPSQLTLIEISCIAIAIYKSPDVRPILQAYAGKDVAIEYAEKEAEAKQKHIEEWKSKARGLSKGGFTLSGMFGGPTEVSLFLPPSRATTDFYHSAVFALTYPFDIP